MTSARAARLGVALLFHAATVLAVPTSKLTYVVNAPARERACPDETAFRKAVSGYLGYDPFFHWAERTVVVEVIERSGKEGGGYAARLKIVRNDGRVLGEREVGSGTQNCGEVVRGIALATSLALDDLDKVADPAPTPRVDAPAETPAVEAAPPEVPPRRLGATLERKPNDRLEAVFAFDPWVGFGMGGAASLGVAVSGGIARTGWRLMVEGRPMLPRETALHEGGSLKTWAALATILPCASWKPLSVCGVVGMGYHSAQSENIRDPASARGTFGVLGLRTLVAMPLGEWFDLHAWVEADAPLARPSVYVSGVSVATWAPVTLVGGFGGGTHF